MNGLFDSVHPLDVLVMVVYFGVIVFVGLQVGKFTKTTQEFFFAGQRFSWWLVAISCVATLVGSYSFQMYSESGFHSGFSSVMPYMNEWFVLPIFLVGWLPIIYYSRVQSIPEFFERRFDRRTRIVVLMLVLVYLEVYIGINLLTIGVLMHSVFDWQMFTSVDANILVWAAVMAVISASYLHHGGQTSVLMTDLVQGLLLLVVGLGLFGLGIHYLGGPVRFWEGLPADHRMPLAPLNYPPKLHAVGDFWNDAMIGTFAFFCINQGVLMRFLAVKSVRDGRKAMFFVVLILMPLAAVSVSSAGWVGRSMYEHGELPESTITEAVGSQAEVEKQIAENIFVSVARVLCNIPGMFGLVIAAVVAALMSTLDTLICAVSAVAVNDVWREVRPGRDDGYYLRAARRTAIAATVLGLTMIPIRGYFASIYQALSFFTSLIIPPLVVVILLGITWRRFTARAAFWTLVLGSAAMVISVWWPEIVEPFAHGASAERGYPYMRGLFGLVISLTAALGFTWLDIFVFKRSETDRGESHEGLLIGTIDQARAMFKGGKPSERGIGNSVELPLRVVEGEAEVVNLSPSVMQALEAEPGDLIYITDARWWLGGFRSLNTKAGPAAESDGELRLSRRLFEAGHLLPERRVRVEKVM